MFSLSESKNQKTKFPKKSAAKIFARLPFIILRTLKIEKK
jgi:hypothetical protein